MTPEEEAAIRAAAQAEAAAAPDLTPAQRDYLNALFRPEIVAITSRIKDR